MRDISLTAEATDLPANTFVIYGDTRTGKTRWAATSPRPLIIADTRERGYETILNMDRSLWFEPDVEPIIKGVDEMGDFAKIIEFARPLIASGRICSVVADAWTFYCDFYLAKLLAASPGVDNRQIYGKLGTHLQWCRNEMHSLPVNVFWNCLAAAPEAAENGPTKNGGPLIPGSQGPKFAAGVNYLFYTRMMQTRKEGKIVDEKFELRTKQYGMYAAGSRSGVTQLPDPFIMTTFADFMPWMGYDADQVRASLKPIAQTVVKPAPGAAPAKPPIQNRPVARPQVRPAVTNNSAPKAVPPTGSNRP